MIGLQLALAVLALAASLKIGELVSENIEQALGEKPLRDRSGE
jgi:hypothetical protein